MVDGEEAHVCLSSVGQLVQESVDRIPFAYVGVELLNRVVMPNYVHILLQITAEIPVSLHSIVRLTKTMVTRQLGYSVWQSSYYDHVVRNESDALRFWKYIDENPKKWVLDPYHV